MGELEDNDAFFDRFHKDHPNDVIGLSEYGADANPAYQSEHPEKGDWSELYQAIYHEHMLKMWSERPYIWAMHCWNMFDFAADGREEGGKPGQNQKGLVTFDRKIKKDAFYLYKAYLSKTPFVHLCGRRYVDRPGKATEIKVYTNQPRVSLYQDGKPVACQSGDKVFVFQVELAGEHCIRAEAGKLSDEIHIRSVERENPSYRCGSTGVVNWFDKPEEMMREGYYSVFDSMGEIKQTPEGAALVADLMGRVRSAYGEVARNVTLPPAAQKMPDQAPFYKTLKHAGKAVTPAMIKELNAALNQIPKKKDAQAACSKRVRVFFDFCKTA